MTVKNLLIDLRTQVIEQTEVLIKFLAKFFGYPENKGMPIIEDATISKLSFIKSLPIHNPNGWPPRPTPETFWQMIFGTKPNMDTIEKVIYESPKDGYYNFYIQNYKNLYFLPDWLSEFLQIRLNLCLDITYLEMAREALFIALFIYMQMLNFRLALYWYLSINPYTRPWIYFIAMTDWIQDALAGFTPSILGVDLMPSLIIGLTGKLADSLNHLVFTMPFLPSEGQRAKMLIDGSLRDILVFRYLPVLWYKHPIPNDIREFWYSERPEILNYMKKYYKTLDIEFLPNRVLKEVYQHQHSISDNINITNSSSLQIASSNLLDNHESTTSLIHYKEQFYNFLLAQVHQLTI